MARQRLEEYQQALRIRYNMTSVPVGLIHPPLHSAPSVHLPTHLQLPTAPAEPAYSRTKPQTSVEVPTRESDMLASPPRLLGSKLLPDEVVPVSNSPRNQRPDATAWLTNNIMERVTEHLPVRARPSSFTTEPLPYKLFTTHHSTSIPLQPTSYPTQAISPSITDDAPLVPGHAAVKPGSLQTGSPSSREDDMERQRRELQDIQRRVLEHKEAVALQQRQQKEERQRQEVEMEQMRQQKETLQALIHTDAQVRGLLFIGVFVTGDKWQCISTLI